MQKIWKNFSPARPTITFLGIAMVLAIGLMGFITPLEISWSIFYLIPILLVIRYSGKQDAFWVTTLAIIVFLLRDLSLGLGGEHPFSFFWNEATCSIGFLGIALYLAKRRERSRWLEERIREKTASLTFEIHRRQWLEAEWEKIQATLRLDAEGEGDEENLSAHLEFFI